MTEYDYFLYFLRHKIDSGVKQVDIVRSSSISTAYLNKLYLRPPKSCDISVITKIANHFGLTYEEMIAEAERLYIEKKQVEKVMEEVKGKEKVVSTEAIHEAPDEERRSRTPSNLVNHLSFVSESIQLYEKQAKSLEDQKDQLLNILNSVSTGFCVVDENLKIAYQNPMHKKIFGNRKSEYYSYFWDEDLPKRQFYDKLTTGEYETVEKVYKKVHYRVELSATYKGDRIIQILEHVIPLEKQQVEYSTKVDVYEHVFEELGTDYGFGFAFFNLDRELEIASNKFGDFLDKYDYPRERPTVDQLLLDLGKRNVEDGPEKAQALREIYENREETVLMLKMDGKLYSFKTKKVNKHGSLHGLLLIIRKEGKQ